MKRIYPIVAIMAVLCLFTQCKDKNDDGSVTPCLTEPEFVRVVNNTGVALHSWTMGGNDYLQGAALGPYHERIFGIINYGSTWTATNIHFGETKMQFEGLMPAQTSEDCATLHLKLHPQAITQDFRSEFEGVFSGKVLTYTWDVSGGFHDSAWSSTSIQLVKAENHAGRFVMIGAGKDSFNYVPHISYYLLSYIHSGNPNLIYNGAVFQDSFYIYRSNGTPTESNVTQFFASKQ